MNYLGLIIGLVFGTISGLLFHIVILGTGSFSFLAPLLPFVQPFVDFINLITPSFGGIWVLIIQLIYWLLFNFIVVFFIYLIGNLGYSPQYMQQTWDNNYGAGTSITDVNNIISLNLFNSAKFAFGFFLGASIATNFIILFLITFIPFLNIIAFLSLIPILIIFSSSISRSRIIQGLIGWTTWFVPLSILVVILGIPVAIYGMISGAISHGSEVTRIDPTSGTWEIQFNFPFNNLAAGFSLGFFSFLNSGSISYSGLNSFLTKSVSAHESGHTLNTASFGGFFLLVDALDENVLLMNNSPYLSFGELIAESRAPGTHANIINPYLPIWSG